MVSRAHARFEARLLPAGACAALLSVAAHAADPTRIAGARGEPMPVDNARCLVDGTPVFRGTFAANLVLDSISIGDATFRAEDMKIHGAADVRVLVRDESGWRTLVDDEIASGAHGVRVVAGRDFLPPPGTALDAMSSGSIASMLVVDGTRDVRIDVMLPLGVADNAKGRPDRMPEVLLVGPPPRGSIELRALLAGSIDDPVVSTEGLVVDADVAARCLSGFAVLFGGATRPLVLAMAGFDLDAVGATDGAALGFRVEAANGSAAVFKLFGLGDAASVLLGSAEDPMASLGLVSGGTIGGGGGGGGGGRRGRSSLPPAVFIPPSIFGGGGGVSIDGGGGGGGGGSRPPAPPVIPAPAVPMLAAVLALLGNRRRRR
jgi:hypothetical protein